MSQAQSTPSITTSEESFSRLINCSSINHNLETTIIQDTFTTSSDKKDLFDHSQIIYLEIIFNLILIGIAILVQCTSSTAIDNFNVDVQGVEINHQLINN